jgi:hypothetical protein
MTGRVTDDEGRPVAGAKVTIILDFGEWYGPNPWVLTDASGRYRVNFMAVPGSNHYPGLDPPGTKEAVGFVLVEASGYDWHSRYVLGTTEHLVENIRLRRIQRITAGESAVLAVAPDDKACGSDAWPGRGLICGTLRVVAPHDGTMTIEAVPGQAGSQLPTLEVWSDRTGGRGNPTSISVVAGTEYTVNVELPWGISASQSFVVKTSL